MVIPEPRKMTSGNYYIQLRLGGQSISITAASAKECKREAQKLKADYRSGFKGGTFNSGKITLVEAINAYIAAEKNVLSPSTIRGYETIKRTRFKVLMDQKIKDIAAMSTISLQAIINAESTLCAPKTLKNSWSFIGSVMSLHGFDLPNLTLPQIVPKERPWLTPDQYQIFIADVQNERFAIPAMLALLGLRRSEIMGLKWGNISIDRKTKSGVITISGAAVVNADQKLEWKATNKNASSQRRVPVIIPELYTALAAEIGKHSPEDPISNSNVNTLWGQINRVCVRNGLPAIGVHGARHSFASLGYALGVNEKQMMALGGWSDNATMRKIYTHIGDASIAEASLRMSEYLSHKEVDSDKNA